jgi:hypothetical protein
MLIEEMKDRYRAGINRTSGLRSHIPLSELCTDTIRIFVVPDVKSVCAFNNSADLFPVTLLSW